MKNGLLKRGWNATGPFVLSSALATSWYLLTRDSIGGPLGAFVPLAGAIAIAALLPSRLSALKIEEAVQKSSLKLSQRLKALEQHLIVNVVDNDGILTECNDLFVETTGYDRQELVGSPVSKLYHDGAGKRLARQIHTGLQRGQAWQGETPLRRADGSVVFHQTTVIPLYDNRGNWIGSISARTDVTQLNQLMQRHETMETLDELRDDIWILDRHSERLTYVNRVASSRLGWSSTKVSAQSLSDIEDQEGLKQILSACDALKQSGEYLSHFQTVFMGTPFYVSVKYLRVENQSDRFLIMLNDVSDRVADELKRSEVISMVSHELRSPLTSIKGSMGLLLSNAAGELPEKAKDLVEIAHRNADRLVLIINDILDLEKITSGGMEFDTVSVDLSTLLHEANDANAMLRQRHGVKVAVEAPEYPVHVTTDPNRIIQVLTNLLANAFKFSEPGGKVTLRLREMGTQVAVSVTDEGPGIPAKDQHKIFERFADLANSERNQKGGTGLGLSICKAIVESLGGSIGFETQEGHGTSFYFLLPRPEGLSRTDDSGNVLSKAS